MLDKIYILSIVQDPEWVYLGTFQSKQDAVAYTKEKQEVNDGISFFSSDEIEKEIIKPTQECCHEWVIREVSIITVLRFAGFI